MPTFLLVFLSCPNCKLSSIPFSQGLSESTYHDFAFLHKSASKKKTNLINYHIRKTENGPLIIITCTKVNRELRPLLIITQDPFW
jgi:hypothetical protein